MKVLRCKSDFLARWQRIDLISSKAAGIQNGLLPLAGNRGWEKSSVARQGWASILMDSLMRSLSTAQRLPIVLSRPLSLWPNTCFINSPTLFWCWSTQKKQKRKTWWWKDPQKMKGYTKQWSQCLIEPDSFFRRCCCFFFSACLFHKLEGRVLISGFAGGPWNTTPDLTSVSTVKTRASCYFSSDYFISKSSTINHYPLLEKYNAYIQTEACNQSFTVTGTGGFQRVNRGNQTKK